MALPATAEAAPQNRHGIAVIIGNKDYGLKIPAVDFAHNDADAMRGYVLDVMGFREGNVIDLRDATLAEVKATFGDERNHKGRLFNWVRAEKSDVVVFYSGHGVPGLKDKRGYLLPVDGDANLAEFTGYPLETLYTNLTKIPAKSVTVFIDACFSGDTPKGMLVRALSGIAVVAKPAAIMGLTVLTAARGDQVASWDEQAKHGLFTEHLIKALYGEADGGDWGNGDGAVTLAEVGAYLKDEMAYQARRRHNREQTPTIQGRKNRVLARFGKGARPERRRAGTQVAAVPKPAKPEVKLEPVEGAYITIKNANVRAAPDVGSAKAMKLPAGTEVYVPGRTSDGKWLKVERDGKGLGYIYAPLLQEKEAWETAKREVEKAARRQAEAEAKRQRLAAATPPRPSGGTTARPAVGTYRTGRRPGEVFKDCHDCPEMVVIPAGSFQMGSPPSEEGRSKDEGPQHHVTIAKPFAVGKFEVTFAEWDACVLDAGCGGYRPKDRGWGRGRRPAIYVSWKDARAYVDWLSRETGKTYRLLSEAEWEYMARAGTTTPFHFGSTISTAQANYDGNYVYGSGRKGEYRRKTIPVGSFSANRFG
ncbi:MAG: SUMF1/EgtB/PvdO family nonheme iron enzyme, partial [Alphaproteobacteria bacterium]|nr:SUMF1/EgtB/PvdO family nonheme iron enzyme [Alphaproteobacteria bacterium]